MAVYTYSVLNDTLNGGVSLTSLSTEIQAQLLSFDYIIRSGDVLDVYFTVSLSVGDESILTTIVNNHTGVPPTIPGEDLEDFVLLDGTRPMLGNFDVGGNDVENVGLINDIDILLHSSRHEYGGEDWVYGDRLAINYTPANYTQSTTFSGITDVKHLSSHLEGVDAALGDLFEEVNGDIFGDNTSNSNILTLYSTTSENFTQAHRLNFSTTVSGTYRVGWFYVWSYDSSSNDFLARVQLDDSITLFNHREEPADSLGTGSGGTDQRLPTSGFKYLTVVSGEHYIDLDIAAGNNGTEAVIHDAVFEVWRVF